MKVFFPGHHLSLLTVAPPEGFEFIHVCGFCDFAFGFAQNDRGGRHDVKMEGFRIRGTKKRESGVMGIGFLLMPGTLFLIDSSVEY